MIGYFCKLMARWLSKPAVVDWLVARAKRTPYVHITGPDGSVYMERYWLFNPYPANSDGAGRRWGDWLPSIRVHRIMRPDGDQHLHDHPWNARTFILRGDYTEMREDGRTYWRRAGDTAALKFGEYHRITSVSDGGVWTLFMTGKHRGTWGFSVDGVKVPWRRYLGIDRSS